MILKGDSTKRLPFKDNCFDAIVTDPPYGLEFMGKEWDRLSGYFGNKDSFEYGSFALPRQRKRNIKCPKCGKWVYDHHPKECQCGGVKQLQAHQMQLWHTQWLTEAYRVLKPGGSMLVMGGTRTFHRLACAIEDSGFIIKDTLMWVYGSGFPKCQDITPMIDSKVLGITTKQVKQRRKKTKIEPFGREHRKTPMKGFGTNIYDGGLEANNLRTISQSLTPEAKHWNGFKVGGIKPAYEPIIWAVKPPGGSYVDNVLKHGVGAVNVDECRISHNEPAEIFTKRTSDKFSGNAFNDGKKGRFRNDDNLASPSQKGRFPANIILDEESGRILDEQSGGCKSGSGFKGTQNHPTCFSGFKGNSPNPSIGGDSGGASRFFYCAKASRSERNMGLEGMEEKDLHWSSGHKNPGSFQSDGTKKKATNAHPTVKPIKLFEWLIRLVTREGQVILDPFFGSGTTAIAAHNAGRKCVGIEKEDEYLQPAKKRIEYWKRQPKQMELR